MRSRPVLRRGHSRHAITGARHPERPEKALTDGVFKAFARRLRQYFTCCIKGDILVSMACTGRTLQWRGHKAAAQCIGIFPSLKLIVKRVFGQASLVRKQLGEREPRFRAAG